MDFNWNDKDMKRIVILILAFGLICGCVEQADETSTTGDIVGSVSDKSTGEPVATANIVLSPGENATVTGSDGSFEYKGLEPGEYAITINKEGYKSTRKTVTVKAGESTPVHLLLEMIPAIITPDRDVLDFGEQEGVNTLSFSIVNSGYEALEWSIEEYCDWVTDVKPKSDILGHGKTATIVVVIDREQLLSGKNETVLIVRSTNGRAELTVTAIGKTKTLPVLNTLDVTNATSQSAVFNAQIIDNGSPKYTERGFVYSTSSNPSLENTIETLTATITDDSEYSVSVTNLTVGTRYYVRGYAKNFLGVSYSTNVVSFEPVQTLPTVVTEDPSSMSVGLGRATFNGNIKYLGDPAYTEKGFVYGPVHNPTVDDDIKKVVSGKSDGVYSANVSGLEMNTIYYVRAYATNSLGTAYGTEKMVDMSQIMPQVTTKNAQDITGTSATLYASLDSVGDPALSERGFIYGAMPVPTMDLQEIVKVAVAGSAVGDYTSYVSGLTAGTTYYVRAYAVAAEKVSYGEVISFKAQDPNYIVLADAGIMVQKEDIGFGSHYSVNMMCENSISSGYTDWRLPTIDELMVLFNNRMEIGGFDTTNNSYSTYSFHHYWSSDLFDGYYQSGYYYIDFSTGDATQFSDSGNYSGRCVRTIK